MCIKIIETKVYQLPVNRKENREFWNNQGSMNVVNNQKLSPNERSIAKNVILFVGDGMGMSTITASRILKGQKQKNISGEEEILEFEKFPSIGLSKTYSVDRQVPDSASTATAMFCGVKTRSRRLGMDKDGEALPSILKMFQDSKKRTGFVTTTGVTHATPAALYASITTRDYECDSKIPENDRRKVKDIARQLVEDLPGRDINVILGGGRIALGQPKVNDFTPMDGNEYFKGEFSKFCKRNDTLNLVDQWLHLDAPVTKFKRKFVTTNSEFSEVDPNEVTHLLGLFAGNHLPFNIIRNKALNGQPSLAEMTEKALLILNHGHDTPGFFLMVEGGRIDHGHHQNHAHIALDETLEFESAIKVALNMTNKMETLIIVTADHSHAMTINGYPDRGNDILDFVSNTNPFETLTYANGPAFYDHRVWDNQNNNMQHGTWINPEILKNRSDVNYRHFAAIPLIDETHGGEDVPVYATGPGSFLIRGSFEQNYIAHVMSYVACVGPNTELNIACKNPAPVSSGPESNANQYSLILLSSIVISILHLI